MTPSFNLSEFRTVNATFNETIDVQVVDSRIDNPFEAKGVTLEEYNEIIEFFTEHDHMFAMNMAKEKFRGLCEE